MRLNNGRTEMENRQFLLSGRIAGRSYPQMCNVAKELLSGRHKTVFIVTTQDNQGHVFSKWQKFLKQFEVGGIYFNYYSPIHWNKIITYSSSYPLEDNPIIEEIKYYLRKPHGFIVEIGRPH